jgi:hypothetical protein
VSAATEQAQERLHQVTKALQRLREAQATGLKAEAVMAAVDLLAAEAALAEAVAVLEAEAKK